MFKHISFLCMMIFVGMHSLLALADEPAFNRVMQNKTIHCGYFVWPPYIAKDPNTGALSGINYEIMEGIAKNIGFTVQWTTEIGPGDVVEALRTQKVDAMCSALWPIPARVQNMTFSLPTFFNFLHAFTRAGDERFDDDLGKANNANIKVAVIDGDATQFLTQEKLPKATFVTLPQTASGAELLLQLVTKKADLTLVEQSLATEFLKNNPDTLRRVKNIPPGRVFGEHIAFNQGEYQLKNMVDLAITQLVNDGVIAAIAKKYSDRYHTEFLAPAQTFAPFTAP